MNNLKRVLSLALASVMLIGMMAVGASATDVSEFSDGESVTHAEAVSTMATLGVIKGYPDGTYLPEKVVTRAEMAAIITRVLNGGVEPTLGTATSPLFTDVTGWARPYVEYCANLHIVDGMGDGTFHPDDTVTASQAAKMLLGAAGYKSNIFGFTGPDWELNVNRIANQQHLYDELTLADTNTGLKRDDAAQMAYNTLPIRTVTESYTEALGSENNSITYQINGATVLNRYFGVKTWIGTYVGNYVSGNANALKDEIVVTNGYLESDNTVTGNNLHFPGDLDLKFLGEEVKVLFKDSVSGTANMPDNKDTIIGVFVTGNTTVYNTTKGAITAVDTTNKKVTFGGTKYDYTGTGTVYTNYDMSAGAALNDAAMTALKVATADDIKFVTDANGKITDAYVTHRVFDVIDSVNSTKVAFKGSQIPTLTIASNDLYEGFAKGDVVVGTMLYDASDSTKVKWTVEKATTLTGNVTKFWSTSKVEVDGTTLTKSGDARVLDSYGVTDLVDTMLGKEYEFVTYGNRWVAYKATTEATKDYAIVLAANDGDDISGQNVKLLLADGTEKTYKIASNSNVGNNALTSYYTAAAVTAITAAGATVKDSTGYGMLVSYSINNDGEVKMTKLTTVTGEKGKYMSATKSIDIDDDDPDLVLTASGCVAFIKTGTTWSVYKADSLANQTGQTIDIQYGLDSDNKVAVFAIETAAAPATSTSDFKYAYLTAAPVAALEGTKTYTTVAGVDASGEAVSIKASGDQVGHASLKAGSFVKYKVDADGITDPDTIILITNTDRVTEYDADRKILVLEIAGTKEVLDDVVIVNVDLANGKAGTNTGIATADAVNTTYQNVAYLLNSGKVEAVFVDDNKNISIANAVTLNSPTEAAVEHQLLTGAVTITGTMPANIDVDDGQTLTVQSAALAAVTVKDGGTLILDKAGTDYDLTKITGETGATVKFSSNVNTAPASGKMDGWYTAEGTTPAALADNVGNAAAIAANVTGKTYVKVADVDTDAGDTTAGFLKQ